MPISEAVALWPVTKQAAGIRSGDFTSRELLELFITRIERINGELNAVITLDLDTARTAADEADRQVAAGNLVGPLHGVPITIKDALETKALRSTGGATELHNNIPQQDAPVVAALKAAGAFVFGKTNLPRWSGDLQSYNEMFGTTVNPWNVERVPGESSGGAAAAVAAGLTAFEIGTDIGGSIRIPSAYCGVFGHKPSWGVVPTTGYLDHVAGGTTEADVNVLGPIARSAEDLELLLDLIVKQDQPLVANLPPAPDRLQSLRVAAWLDDDYCRVDQKVLDVMNNAVAKLEASGIAVDHNARPNIDPEQALQIGGWLVTAAMAQSMPAENVQGAGIDSGLGGVTHRQWLDKHREREQIRTQWDKFFQDYDVLLLPTTFVPPFEHLHEGNFGTRTLQCNGADRGYADMIRWTILTGMAFWPSTVPPIGRDADGLPVSFQVVGPYGGDYTTIRLAGYISALCGGYQAPPLAL